MSSLTNQVHLLGHVGKDPEIKTLQSGKKKASFSVATKYASINEQGKRIESTEWVTVVAWEGRAEIAEKYLHKGKQVAICGRLHTHDYTDSSGQRKWFTEVIASEILLLGGKTKEEEAA